MTIEQMLDKADRLLDYGDTKKALTIYEQALTSLSEPKGNHPDYLEIMAAIADTQIMMGKFRDAGKTYETIMKHPDADPIAFLHLRHGQIAYELNNLPLAHAALNRALELGGEDLFEDEPEEYIECARTPLT